MQLKVHRKRPDSRLTLQYDKLHVDNAIYVYNEETDSIELLNVAEIQAEYENQVKSLKILYFWKYYCYLLKVKYSILVTDKVKTRQKVNSAEPVPR